MDKDVVEEPTDSRQGEDMPWCVRAVADGHAMEKAKYRARAKKAARMKQMKQMDRCDADSKENSHGESKNNVTL